jgi:hypothetical protein
LDAPLLGFADWVLGPALGERETDSLVGVGVLVLVLVGTRQQHRTHVDEPQRGIVFPARGLPAAEVQQVAAAVQERMQFLKAPGDERAEMRHRAVLPEKPREEADGAVDFGAVDFVDCVDTNDRL